MPVTPLVPVAPPHTVRGGGRTFLGRGVLAREKRATGIDLGRQRRSCGKQRVGIGGGLAALQRAGDQADVEPRRAVFRSETPRRRRSSRCGRSSSCNKTARDRGASSDTPCDPSARVFQRPRSAARCLSSSQTARRLGNAGSLPAWVAPAARTRAPSARPHDRDNRCDPVAGNRPRQKCRSVQNTESLGPQSADSAAASLRTRSSACGDSPASVTSAISTSL